jgi:hypothetical protein
MAAGPGGSVVAAASSCSSRRSSGACDARIVAHLAISSTFPASAARSVASSQACSSSKHFRSSWRIAVRRTSPAFSSRFVTKSASRSSYLWRTTNPSRNARSFGSSGSSPRRRTAVRNCAAWAILAVRFIDRWKSPPDPAAAYPGACASLEPPERASGCPAESRARRHSPAREVVGVAVRGRMSPAAAQARRRRMDPLASARTPVGAGGVSNGPAIADSSFSADCRERLAA